jgi:serine/threonine-protein kinase
MASCPKCGTPLEADARFCGNCGSQTLAGSVGDSTNYAPQEIAPPKQRGGGSPAVTYQPVNHVDQLVGRVLNGRYRVGKKIGAGGFGGVFEGTHLQMDRPVAIKVLNPSLSRDPKMVARFKREAQAASTLRDPHTVVIYDFDQSEEGVLYIAMELIRGRSLLDEIQRCTAIPPDRALVLFDQVCSALVEAHDREIVHRDIKPENILIEDRPSQPDFIKVVDFGIAKIVHDPSGDSIARLTAAGQIFGTLEYMSPEQLAGGLDVDHRADIYALGAMLCQMLTGSPPFSGTPTQLIAAHLHQDPEPPSARLSTLSPEIDRIVLRCMAKSPDDRFPNVQVLRNELMALHAKAATAPAAVAAEPMLPPTMTPAHPPTAPQAHRSEAPAAAPATEPPAPAPSEPKVPPTAAPVPGTAAPVPPTVQRAPAAAPSSSSAPATHQIRPPPLLPAGVWFLIGLVALLVLGGGGYAIYAAISAQEKKGTSETGEDPATSSTDPGSATPRSSVDWSKRGQLARLAPSDAQFALSLRPSVLMTLPGAQELWRSHLQQHTKEVLDLLKIGPDQMEEALVVVPKLPTDGGEPDETLIAVRGVDAPATVQRLRKWKPPTEEKYRGYTLLQFPDFCLVQLDDRTLAGAPVTLIKRALVETGESQSSGATELAMLVGESQALAAMHVVVPQQALRKGNLKGQLKLSPEAAIHRIISTLRQRKANLLLTTTLFTDSRDTALTLSSFADGLRQQLLASPALNPATAGILRQAVAKQRGKRVIIKVKGNVRQVVQGLSQMKEQSSRPRPRKY